MQSFVRSFGSKVIGSSRSLATPTTRICLSSRFPVYPVDSRFATTVCSRLPALITPTQALGSRLHALITPDCRISAAKFCSNGYLETKASSGKETKGKENSSLKEYSFSAFRGYVSDVRVDVYSRVVKLSGGLVVGLFSMIFASLLLVLGVKKLAQYLKGYYIDDVLFGPAYTKIRLVHENLRDFATDVVVELRTIREVVNNLEEDVVALKNAGVWNFFGRLWNSFCKNGEKEG